MKKKWKYRKSIIISYACGTCMLLIMVGSCEKDYLVPKPVPVPKVPVETATLEAIFVTTSPSSVNSNYWKEADYLKVQLTSISKQNLYTADALLNMTGTYNGLSDFNDGAAPELTLRAAYDNNKLYILAEWTDSDIDASYASWLWDGPSDPFKSDTTGGWTSQRNNDKLALAFEIETASSSSGTFTNVGCAASCHNNAMQPQTGKVDIWNWSLALSEPLGYAFDMVTDADSGLIYDSGQKMFERNNTGVTNRSGPAYEWNGITQSITKPDGSNAILDPAFFLLNKTSFTGDPSIGENLHLNNDKGCTNCHGVNGEGGGVYGDGPAFTNPSFNRLSRTVFDELASAPTHTGQSYYNQLNATEKTDLISRIRGFSGVPGHYLTTPAGSNADITTSSNILIAKINPANTEYKILLIRKLDTGNDDDVRFDLTASKTYKFGIALMDNDGKNHIGSLIEILTFKDQ